MLGTTRWSLHMQRFQTLRIGADNYELPHWSVFSAQNRAAFADAGNQFVEQLRLRCMLTIRPQRASVKLRWHMTVIPSHAPLAWRGISTPPIFQPVTFARRGASRAASPAISRPLTRAQRDRNTWAQRYIYVFHIMPGYTVGQSRPGK